MKTDTDHWQTNDYDDIIGLPHHVSQRHPQMPMADRAAQFSPFAALTGYEDAVRETVRLTERRIELDEYERERLDEQLRQLIARSGEAAQVCITYFCPDEHKEGGQYVTASGQIRQVDAYHGYILMSDHSKIAISEIVNLKSED